MPVTVTLEDDTAQELVDHHAGCRVRDCLLCAVGRAAVNSRSANHDFHGTPVATCTCRQPDDRNLTHRFDGSPCRSLYRVDL